MEEIRLVFRIFLKSIFSMYWGFIPFSRIEKSYPGFWDQVAEYFTHE